jgi:hypothetical protein
MKMPLNKRDVISVLKSSTNINIVGTRKAQFLGPFPTQVAFALRRRQP